jgi:hypothetical protein
MTARMSGGDKHPNHRPWAGALARFRGVKLGRHHGRPVSRGCKNSTSRACRVSCSRKRSPFNLTKRERPGRRSNGGLNGVP